MFPVQTGITIGDMRISTWGTCKYKGNASRHSGSLSNRQSRFETPLRAGQFSRRRSSSIVTCDDWVEIEPAAADAAEVLKR